MRTIKADEWPKRQTQLEKFMVERILQRCDADTVISKKHRTTSGYTLVNEMIHLCDITEDKPRYVKTLISTIKESRELDFGQNICSDIIIDKYFVDLKHFIKSFDIISLGNMSEVNYSNLKTFKHQLQIYFSQLEENYYNFLMEELKSIKFGVTKIGFNREADKLTKLIDLKITYLVHNGYSTSSFFEVLNRWIETGYRITARRVIQNFRFAKKQINIVHKFNSKKGDIVKDFISIIEKKFAKNIKTYDGSEVPEGMFSGFDFSETDFLVTYTVTCVEPHSFLRTLFDEIIKNIVVLRNRHTLSTFNRFFLYSYWKFNSKSSKIYNKFKLYDDPINVKSRKNTLIITLKKCNYHSKIKLVENGKLPIINNPQLNAAIYFYHLALGSKSIENSLSLLWTSLESLLPYYSRKSNIESVKEFVSKSLSIGAVSRQLQSFTNRYNSYNQNTPNPIKVDEWKWKGRILSSEELVDFFNLITNLNDEGATTITSILKDKSNLIAMEFTSLGKPLSSESLFYLKTKIENSEKSIRYQLQRIYLYRNQIVHSGEMINEYTNLWKHLEWYVGKLLFYAVSEVEIYKNSNSLEDCFRKLEGEMTYLISYLEMNKKIKVKKVSPRITNLIFKNNWQSF